MELVIICQVTIATIKNFQSRSNCYVKLQVKNYRVGIQVEKITGIIEYVKNQVLVSWQRKTDEDFPKILPREINRNILNILSKMCLISAQILQVESNLKGPVDLEQNYKLCFGIHDSIKEILYPKKGKNKVSS